MVPDEGSTRKDGFGNKLARSNAEFVWMRLGASGCFVAALGMEVDRLIGRQGRWMGDLASFGAAVDSWTGPLSPPVDNSRRPNVRSGSPRREHPRRLPGVRSSNARRRTA